MADWYLSSRSYTAMRELVIDSADPIIRIRKTKAKKTRVEKQRIQKLARLTKAINKWMKPLNEKNWKQWFILADQHSALSDIRDDITFSLGGKCLDCKNPIGQRWGYCSNCKYGDFYKPNYAETYTKPRTAQYCTTCKEWTEGWENDCCPCCIRALEGRGRNHTKRRGYTECPCGTLYDQEPDLNQTIIPDECGESEFDPMMDYILGQVITETQAMRNIIARGIKPTNPFFDDAVAQETEELRIAKIKQESKTSPKLKLGGGTRRKAGPSKRRKDDIANQHQANREKKEGDSAGMPKVKTRNWKPEWIPKPQQGKFVPTGTKPKATQEEWEKKHMPEPEPQGPSYPIARSGAHGYSWKTPGDGLCIVHALLSNDRHFRYYEAISNAYQDICDKYLNPVIRAFLKEAKNIYEADRRSLEEWLAKGNTRELDAVTAIDIYRFCGHKQPIRILTNNRDVKGSHPVMVCQDAYAYSLEGWRKLMADKSYSEQDTFVFFDMLGGAAHAEYMTLGKTIPPQAKPADLCPGISPPGFWGTNVEADATWNATPPPAQSKPENQTIPPPNQPKPENKPDESSSYFSGKNDWFKSAEEKVNPPKTQPETKNPAEPKVHKPTAAATETLSETPSKILHDLSDSSETDDKVDFPEFEDAKIPNVKKSTPEAGAQEKPKRTVDLKSYTGLYWAKSGLTYNHVTQHKIGPDFLQALQGQKLNITPTARKYGHAGLRWAADEADLQMITDACRSVKYKTASGLVVCHAAKFNKLKCFMEHAPDLQNSISVTRPIMDNGYDRTYREKNDYLLHNFNSLLDLPFSSAIDELYKDNPQLVACHVLNDVAYYPETIEEFWRLNPRQSVNFSLQVLPRSSGRYYYYDKEGYIDIENDRVINRPRDNQPGYHHRYVSLNIDSASYHQPHWRTNNRTKVYLNVQKYWSVKTGNSLEHAWYKAWTSFEPEYPAGDWSKVFRMDQPLQWVDLLTEERLTKAKLREEPEHYIRINAKRRRVLPDERYQAILEHYAVPSFNHQQGLLFQSSNCYQKYREQEASLPDGTLLSRQEAEDNYLFWLKAKHEANTVLTSLRRAGVCVDSERNSKAQSQGGYWTRFWRYVHRGLEATFCPGESVWMETVQAEKEHLDSINHRIRPPMYLGRDHKPIAKLEEDFSGGAVVSIKRSDFERNISKPLHLQRNWDELNDLNNQSFQLGLEQMTKTTTPIRTDIPAVKTLEPDDHIDLDKLNVIRSQHFDPKVSKKFFHPVGNANIRIKQRGIDNCDCWRSTYEKVIPVENPVHYGSCTHNITGAIFARGFNSPSRPDPIEVLKFRQWTLAYFKKKSWFWKRGVDSMTADDFSIDHFLSTVEARKRNLYKTGLERFKEKRRINVHMELFSKTNEVHYDDPRDTRPRMLFNPSPEMKAVGAFYARLMIKLLKLTERGFISGYSETALGLRMIEHIKRNEFSSPLCYSYDGSSHDAHQHLALISSVDHVVGPILMEWLLNHPDSPYDRSYFEPLKDALFRTEYPFSTRNGYKGVITGTVFSGHPTLTTLFNTFRTLLYNYYCLEQEGLEEGDYVIWASGDDVLGWVKKKFDKTKFIARLGNQYGPGGLGQVAKDFLWGPIDKQTFLSKTFHRDVSSFIPNPDRLIKAGAVRDFRKGPSRRDHARAMILCHQFLPSTVRSLISDRFQVLADTEMSDADKRKLSRAIDADYAWRLKISNLPLDDSISATAQLVKNQEHLAKTLSSYPSEFNPKQPKFSILRTELKTIVKVDPCGPVHLAQFVNTEAARDLRDLDIARHQQAEIQLRLGRKEPGKLNIMPKPIRNAQKKKSKRNNAKSKSLVNLSANRAQHRFNSAEEAYLKLVKKPLTAPAVKIPSPYPIATHLSQTKSTYTMNTSATGYLVAVLKPHADASMLFTATMAGGNPIVDATVFQSLTFAGTCVSSIQGYAIKRRVVAAYLSAESLASDNNRIGIMTAAYMPYNVITSGVTNIDSLRDQPKSITVNLAKRPKASVRYSPLDLSCLEFLPLTSSLNGTVMTATDVDAPCLVIYISSSNPNSPIVLNLRVIHEIIPQGSVTDILNPEIGPQSSVNPLDLIGSAGLPGAFGDWL